MTTVTAATTAADPESVDIGGATTPVKDRNNCAKGTNMFLASQ